MTYLFVFIFSSLFFFSNTLYYSIVLLVISISTLCVLVNNFIIQLLTIIIFFIVYVGAMMVLIGYICAVSPNLVFNSSPPLSVFLWLIIFCLLLPPLPSPSFSATHSSLVDFFYSPSGVFIFMLLIFILFITLLIVTSQYLSPNGPFRSFVSPL